MTFQVSFDLLSSLSLSKFPRLGTQILRTVVCFTGPLEFQCFEICLIKPVVCERARKAKWNPHIPNLNALLFYDLRNENPPVAYSASPIL